MKRIHWLGTSLNAVREFPDEARAMVGTELRQIQNGLMPSDFKPMTTVGAGVFEIWVRSGNQYRVIYAAKFSEAVSSVRLKSEQIQLLSAVRCCVCVGIALQGA